MARSLGKQNPADVARRVAASRAKRPQSKSARIGGTNVAKITAQVKKAQATRTTSRGAKVKKPKGGIITPGLVLKAEKKIAAPGVAAAAASPGVVKAVAPAGIAGKVGTGLDIFNTITNLGQMASGGGGSAQQTTLGSFSNVATMARDLIPAGLHDISPGIPAQDVQIVDPDNIVINNATGKPAKLVPTGAKIQRRRRFRGRSGIGRAEFERRLEAQKSTDMMQMMMMMALAKH